MTPAPGDGDGLAAAPTVQAAEQLRTGRSSACTCNERDLQYCRMRRTKAGSLYHRRPLWCRTSRTSCSTCAAHQTRPHVREIRAEVVVQQTRRCMHTHPVLLSVRTFCTATRRATFLREHHRQRGGQQSIGPVELCRSPYFAKLPRSDCRLPALSDRDHKNHRCGAGLFAARCHGCRGCCRRASIESPHFNECSIVVACVSWEMRRAWVERRRLPAAGVVCVGGGALPPSAVCGVGCTVLYVADIAAVCFCDCAASVFS